MKKKEKKMTYEILLSFKKINKHDRVFLTCHVKVKKKKSIM